MLEVELPVMFRIDEVVQDAEHAWTLWMMGDYPISPGRFVMVWIPGVGEKPYAISFRTKERFAITVEVRGKFSAKLAQVGKGGMIGIRGPYGRGYETGGRRACFIAGGMGIAAMAMLCEQHPETPLLYGARTADEAIFPGRFPNMRLFTDDGSGGEKGFPTEALPEIIERDKVEVVCACGPEAMMVRVFQICEEHGIECQLSLERYMKCGFGVCGQCACGDRLVCQDGPVFHSTDLRAMGDFGKTALTKSGRRVTIQEYFGG